MKEKIEERIKCLEAEIEIRKVLEERNKDLPPTYDGSNKCCEREIVFLQSLLSDLEPPVEDRHPCSS